MGKGAKLNAVNFALVSVFPKERIYFMEFDFDTFTKVVIRCYPADHPYTLEEVLSVFREYFQAYEDFTGAVHPFINVGQIKRIIAAMPTVNGVHDEITPIEATDYKALIAQHFVTRYKKCDYNINHFFSGDIRLYRLLETM